LFLRFRHRAAEDSSFLLAFRAGTIDLLITDVVMPGLRGPELYQRILAQQPRVRVLFMSGYAEGLPETQLPRGAAFLQNPFSFAALLESLRSLQSVN
jgi:FixJ family two-component response regulator